MEMETVNIGVDLDVIFRISDDVNEEVLLLKSALFSFVEQLMLLRYQAVKLVVFSTKSPVISPLVFDSLTHYQLPIETVIFTGGECLFSYIQSMEIEVYLSRDEELLWRLQGIGVLGGLVPKHLHEVRQLKVSFDHRLFSDEVMYTGMGKWIPLLGLVKRNTSDYMMVEMMTTRRYSVDRSIKELFEAARCKLDAFCFMVSGDRYEFMKLFEVGIYFEGQQKQSLEGPPPEDCLLYIDF